MIEFISKGGPIMYALLACSFYGVYIVVQKLLFLKVNTINSDEQLNKIQTQLTTIGKTKTIKNLRTDRRFATRVLAQGIKLSELPKDDAQDELQDVTRNEIPKLERNMNMLSSIITVAPILGLLGTVLGLIDLFNVISGGNIGDASALASGIAKALITTVTGLGIAIPFIFIHHYLNHRIDRYISDLESTLNKVIRICSTHDGVKP